MPNQAPGEEEREEDSAKHDNHHQVGQSGVQQVQPKATSHTAAVDRQIAGNSMDELLRFFTTRLVKPCFQAIQETSNADLPAPQKLERILRTSLEYAVKHQGLLRLLAETEQSNWIRKNTRPRLLQLVVATFEQGIRERSFRPHDSTHTARMFLGCLSELFELQAGGASEVEVNRFAETLIDATVNGFFIRAEKSPESGKASPSLPNP